MNEIKVGDTVRLLNVFGTPGHVGKVTKVTKNGRVWVSVHSRWGNHHHPATSKTFRCAVNRVKPLEEAQ